MTSHRIRAAEVAEEPPPQNSYDRWASIPEAFFEVAARDPERPLLWARHAEGWRSISRGEAARQVRMLASALMQLGVGRGDRVLLLSENRPEFLIADLAVMSAGAVTVPAYTTNTVADHSHVLEDSEAVLAIVSTGALARRLLPAAVEAPACRGVIAIEALNETDAGGLELTRWDELMQPEEAREHDAASIPVPVSRTETACFIYTSGTGGVPKGVMLSHANLLSNCRMAYDLLADYELGNEVFLSFLPLSHSYEHTIGQCFPITIGAEIYYSRGVEHLTAELTEVRPTVMTAVPRLYELMHNRIRHGVERAPWIRRRLFERARALGRQRYHDPASLTPFERLQDRLLDRLVRDKVRARFGGRLKGMISGGAALDPEVGVFFLALGLTIMQGYGQTEASPVISCNPPHRIKIHTVGPPLTGVEARIAEDGELLVRGPMVMQGYWRMPEATAETVVDGWLHTGDLARIDEDGYIEITDRKKDIIVLSSGDTLSPARVEAFLTRRREIEQAMVYGNDHTHLVAILVPDRDWLKEWTRAQGKPETLAELAEDRELRQALDAAVRDANAELPQVEKVRRFAIASEPFTVENDMLTPTLKVRRHVVRKVYGERLEALY